MSLEFGNAGRVRIQSVLDAFHCMQTRLFRVKSMLRTLKAMDACFLGVKPPVYALCSMQTRLLRIKVVLSAYFVVVKSASHNNSSSGSLKVVLLVTNQRVLFSYNLACQYIFVKFAPYLGRVQNCKLETDHQRIK